MFHMYESKINAEGKRVASIGINETGANGWYDPATGEIWIDLNAGINGEGTILFTAAHELTHFIKDWSLEKYGIFSEFLLKNYAEKGVSVDQLIKQQQEKAKRNSRTLSRDEALDEVIADSCETFLCDSDAVSKIAALKAKDESVANKIKEFISNLMEKVRSLMSRFSPDSTEGKLVSEMNDALEELYSMWTDALTDAGKTYKSGSEQQTIDETNKIKFQTRQKNSRGVEIYTEKQYNGFGWIRANNVMPADYFDNLMSKFTGAKTNNSYARTQDGYYVIPVNGNYDGYGFGVTSFIAYIKGSVAMPDIPLIIEVIPTSENIVDKVIKYEKKKRSSGYKESFETFGHYFGLEYFFEHDRQNYDDYREYKSKSELASGGSSGRKSNNNAREWIFLDEDNSDAGEGGKEYSDRDQSIKTDREILLDALESAAQTENEKSMLRTYRKQADHLAEAEARVKKLNAEIKELSFAPGKRETERIKNLTELRDDAQRVINRADKRLLSLEAAKPLRDVLAREKKKVRAAEKIKREKMRAELKERSEAELADTKAYYRDMVKRNQQKARDSKEKAIADLKAEHKAHVTSVKCSAEK